MRSGRGLFTSSIRELKQSDPELCRAFTCARRPVSCAPGNACTGNTRFCSESCIARTSAATAQRNATRYPAPDGGPDVEVRVTLSSRGRRGGVGLRARFLVVSAVRASGAAP